MRNQLKKLLRTVQSLFPVIRLPKYKIYYYIRKKFRLVHEQEFLALKYINIFPCEVAVDVGSNYGQSILSVCNTLPNSKVIAFEPNTFFVDILKKRYENDPNILIVPVGLSSTEERRVLYIPFYRGFCYDGLASFEKHEALSWINPTTVFFFKENLVSLQESVFNVEKLDNFSLETFLIKIDVQGLEFDVILGAKQTILRNEPMLLIEKGKNYSEISEFLVKYGYAEFFLDSGRLILGAGSTANSIWLTRKRIKHELLSTFPFPE